MSSIVLTRMGCIDYLAFGTICTHETFCSVAAGKKNLIFFPDKKAVDEHWEVVHGPS
jgi:hypothetical protein